MKVKDMREIIKEKEKIMKKKVRIFLLSSLIMSVLAGCGAISANEEEQSMVSTIYEDVEETEIEKEEVVEEEITEETLEEDLSGIVPLSKRANKGKMIAFGCIGDLHNGFVYKIFFFDCGKVTVVTNLEPIGEYEGFVLPSLEELTAKSDEELWALCDAFKENSEEYVQALIANSEDAYNRLTDPNSPDYDLSFAEAVKSQPDSGEIYNIVLPVIDAPFVISIESDETNSVVSVEQIVIATQRVSKTYGGTESTDGGIDFDFSLTNMAEGGEVKIGDKMYSACPTFECNLSFICVEAEKGFQIDSLDTSNTYINSKDVAYEDASKLLVK
ncbi:MAG: hypothetical protein E7299_02595 [Lachnospiraceae bacterium]|nr:hypothetical protein [Lachnospiraceae bacterium]